MSTYRCPKCEVSDGDPNFHQNGCPGSPEGVALDARISDLEERLAELEAHRDALAKRVASLEAAQGYVWHE